MYRKLMEYWNTSVNISRNSNRPSVAVLAKMLTCRLFTGFGPRDYALFCFDGKPLLSTKNYLSKCMMMALQLPVNPQEEWFVVENKVRFYLRCKEAGLPTAEVLGVVGGVSDSQDLGGLPALLNAREVEHFLSAQGDGFYLIKPSDGFHGQGILRIQVKGSSILTDDGVALNESPEFQHLLSRPLYCVLQRSLLPHPALKPIMPGISLGTLRVVTVRKRETVSIVFACAKIPVGACIADNFVGGAAGNLVAGVDLKTGKLMQVFGPDTKGLGLVEEVRHHPDTGETIPGFQYPQWNSICNTVNAAATLFSEMMTIGWDISVTEEGLLLIESNPLYDVDILQVALDRGLKSEFETLLKPVNP